MLGKEVVRLPGGHISYMLEPEVFADALVALLESKIQEENMFAS
jgi:hypothetical protein